MATSRASSPPKAGKRAFFRQKRDTLPGAPRNSLKAKGEVIEYDGRTDNVRFITRAELRRYRGGALSDEITGAVIVYNNLTDVFTVDGQKKATPSADGQTGGGRVRAVLAPRSPPRVRRRLQPRPLAQRCAPAILWVVAASE